MKESIRLRLRLGELNGAPGVICLVIKETGIARDAWYRLRCSNVYCTLSIVVAMISNLRNGEVYRTLLKRKLRKSINSSLNQLEYF